jgi:hypothetical protein
MGEQKRASLGKYVAELMGGKAGRNSRLVANEAVGGEAHAMTPGTGTPRQSGADVQDGRRQVDVALKTKKKQPR